MFKTLKKAINLLTQQEKRSGLNILFLVVGNALLETLGVASIMPFLAVLGNPDMIYTNPFLSRAYIICQSFGINTPYHFLIILGLTSFVLIVASAAYRTYTNYAINYFIEMRRHFISARLFEIYLYQPYVFFLNRHSGDMSKTILSEVDQLVGNVFRPGFNMIAYSFVFIAISMLLIFVNPMLAVVVAGLLGALYVLVFIGLRKRLLTLGKVLSTSNKTRFIAANEAFGGIKLIKLFGREDNYFRRFQTPSRSYAATQAAHETLSMLPHYLIEAIIFGAMLLLILLMLISQGGLNSKALGLLLPTIGLYAFASYRLKPAVHNIYHGFASLRYGKSVVDDVSADLQLKATKPLLKAPNEQIKAKHKIDLVGLTYTYPNSPKPTIKDLSISIPVGTTFGLVGGTGAGKTTLVDLILGLLMPESGHVAVDGRPINEDILRAWQKSLGYVPQDIFLADTSLLENIAMGIARDDIDFEQVVKSAKMAQIHDFIMSELPEMYDTVVGERGVRLSGGQRQRIGVARALYHDPDILVFDEATSSLDNLTEKAVMDAVDALAHQKTVIIIAHRLSTVKNCDQIVLLERGKILAVGIYDELKKNNTKFQEMINVK